MPISPLAAGTPAKREACFAGMGRATRRRQDSAMLEFAGDFLQHCWNCDVLRTPLQALAAFLAVACSLFLLENVVVEELGGPTIPVDRQVVQLQEVGRDIHARWARHAVTATGALHPCPRLVNGLGFLDQRKLRTRKRIG